MLNRFIITTLLLSIPSYVWAQSCPTMPKIKDSQVIGQYNNTKVTLKEIETLIAAELCSAQTEYDKKVSDLRQTALDRYIERQLLEAEAKKNKFNDIQALVEAKVMSQLKEPTEAEMKAEYERVKDRLPADMTFEKLKPQIVEYLGQQAFAPLMNNYLDELKASANVKTDLPVYRVTVPEGGPSKGPKNAKVVIVEYGDYECPYCGQGARVLREVMNAYPKDVRVVFKDFPLDFHRNAVPAAVAARCAGAQGKYWEMHDALFENTSSLGPVKIKSLAEGLKLNMKAFETCSQDPAQVMAVEADMNAGQKIGVEATPAFFVNGIPLSGAKPFEEFKAIVDRELKR